MELPHEDIWMTCLAVWHNNGL